MPAETPETILSVDEAREFLRQDIPADDAFIEELIEAADEFLEDAVGTGYDRTRARAKYLARVLVADMYDDRGIIQKPSGNTRKLIEDYAQQLRLRHGMTEAEV